MNESTAPAGENLLLGTWRLKSYVQLLETGERYDVYGEHPDGYISYAADGRMYVIATADRRMEPGSETPPDEEQIRLYQTMFAYAGTYMVEGDKVVHSVDISWNQSFTGSKQVRFYTLAGNVLTITTAPNTFTIEGREGPLVAVWEKVKAPTR